MLSILREKYPAGFSGADVATWIEAFSTEAIEFRVALEAAGGGKAIKVISAKTVTWRLKSMCGAPVNLSDGTTAALRYVPADHSEDLRREDAQMTGKRNPGTSETFWPMKHARFVIYPGWSAGIVVDQVRWARRFPSFRQVPHISAGAHRMASPSLDRNRRRERTSENLWVKMPWIPLPDFVHPLNRQ